MGFATLRVCSAWVGAGFATLRICSALLNLIRKRKSSRDIQEKHETLNAFAFLGVALSCFAFAFALLGSAQVLQHCAFAVLSKT